jgi:hypothetical protein
MMLAESVQADGGRGLYKVFFREIEIGEFDVEALWSRPRRVLR